MSVYTDAEKAQISAMDKPAPEAGYKGVLGVREGLEGYFYIRRYLGRDFHSFA